MKVFGSSGTRGVANEVLTPEFAIRVAKAIGTIWDADRAAIARDTRMTGRLLAHAAGSGLASVGISVEHLGVVPTPGVQAYAEDEMVPAIMITASHNPPEYNGMKLINASGTELTIPELERVEEAFLAESFRMVTWDEVGEISRVDGGNRRYIEELVGVVDRDRIQQAELRVAIDTGHGAGSLTSPEFFRKLGCTVVTVNGQTDGRFPGRNPEPVEENLKDLRRLVRVADADLGIAHDGDADRAIFVDETGTYCEGDATFAALAAAEIESEDVVVSAVNVSQRIVDIVNEADASLELTPIGSTRIMTRIRELRDSGRQVRIAGEGNGGVIFPEYRLARDGAYTAARFVELVTDRVASEIVSEYETGYENVRVKIPYESVEEREAMLAATREIAEGTGADVTTIDGYRLDYDDGWVLVRPSGTEPLFRIYSEATNADRAEELAVMMESNLLDALDSG